MRISGICALLGITIWALVACTPQGGNTPSADSQTASPFIEVESMALPYLLYLPKDYKQNEKWPLLLFLHGSGEAGTDLEKVKIHGPPMHIASGRELPFIVVSPQLPKADPWQPEQLSALLDDIEQAYRVDKARIYVTGLSLGGYGAWRLANHQPERFAAIAPVCGGGDPAWGERLSTANVWAFHGAKDTVVPVSETINMIAAMKKYCGAPKATVYPDVGHDAWVRAYEEPEFYDWLLEQSISIAR